MGGLRHSLSVAALALLALGAVSCDDDAPTGTGTSSLWGDVVVMETSMGDITIELFRDDAPVTVENFYRYVQKRFYDGLIFHRVIDGFVIQGGGHNAGLSPRDPLFDPIVNESNNGLLNDHGTIAMARTSDPNSATTQFFINVADNAFLNYHAGPPVKHGYCVFGRVIGGMDVVDAIRVVPTHSTQGFSDVPVETIVIERVRRAYATEVPTRAIR